MRELEKTRTSAELREIDNKPNQNTMNMKIFEYTTLGMSFSIKALKELGAEGWELVSVTKEEGEYLAWLKREISIDIE